MDRTFDAKFWRANNTPPSVAKDNEIQIYSSLRNFACHAKSYLTSGSFYAHYKASFLHWVYFPALTSHNGIRLKSNKASTLLEAIVAISLVSIVILSAEKFALSYLNIFSKSYKHFLNDIKRNGWHTDFPNYQNCKTVTANSSYEILSCQSSSEQSSDKDSILRELSK